MGILKKAACFFLAVCMAASVAAVPNTQAYAKATVNSNKVNITANAIYSSQIEVTYSQGDAQIKNIKTSSRNLIAKQTYQDYHGEDRYYSERPYGYARIGLYAKKAGNYKVTFDVCDAEGNKVSSHTVQVKAGDSARYSSPIKDATFAGKEILYQLSSKKSGKFKVTMNKGYRLKSITMETYNASGRLVSKKIKNNAKVTLGEYTYKYENEGKYYDYDYDPVTFEEKRTERWYYNLSTELFARTEFRVEYVNNKTKTTGTVYYTLYRVPKN